MCQKYMYSGDIFVKASHKSTNKCNENENLCTCISLCLVITLMDLE